MNTVNARSPAVAKAIGIHSDKTSSSCLQTLNSNDLKCFNDNEKSVDKTDGGDLGYQSVLSKIS